MTPDKQADKGLPRRRRIVRKTHFAEAYEHGRRCNGRLMTLWLRESNDEPSMRLGVVAGKFVGNAVKRARAKRVLREIFRLNRHKFSGATDVVLRARPELLAADRSEVEADLLALAARAGILAKAEEETGQRPTSNIERPTSK